MEFGASIFFTDYSITPAELAVAMEERGFDSVWAAEHSHIPVPRRTRADSELGKRYYDVMDPFVTLTAAACATNGKPGFSILDSSSGRETDSPLEERRFEPPVPLPLGGDGRA